MNCSFKHIIIFLWSLARKHSNIPIDALTFGYTGNMLHQVADGENNSLGFNGTGTYTYDVAGRMINDSHKGTIAYNHLGLTKSVTKGTDVLKYTYDATGRRIKKQLNNATPRWYMDGIERSGDTTMIHTEYGRIRRNAAADPWKWDYFLKDHLGNVRVVLAADPATSSQSSSNRVVYMATMEEGASPNPLPRRGDRCL
jgi:YD repeat-containing protein